MGVENSIRCYTFIQGTNLFQINMKVAAVIVFVVLAQLSYMVVEAKPSSKQQQVQDLIEKKLHEELARDQSDVMDDMDDEEFDLMENDPIIAALHYLPYHAVRGVVRLFRRWGKNVKINTVMITRGNSAF